MTYCFDSGIAAFEKGEGLDLSAMPQSGELDAAWCLYFMRAIRDVAFAIADACIEYGTCAACLEQCIESGSPYKI